MGFWAVAGPIIASVAGSLLSSRGGGSSASTQTSQSNQVTPAGWSALGPGYSNMSNLWSSLAGQLRNAGSYSGEEGYYQRDILSDLLSSMTGASADYLSGTGAATDDYLSAMSGLRQPAFDLSIGGQDFGVTPQRNAMLADLASNTMGARIAEAQRGFDVQSALNQLGYNVDEAGSPLSLRLTGIEQLWPYINQAQSWRFGLPSSQTIGTESAQYNPSIWETIGNAVNTGQTVMDLWNSVSPYFQTSQANTATVPNTWGTGVGSDWYGPY